MAPADTGGDAMLLAAAGRGGVWAVGVGYDGQGEGRPLAMRWDGRAWYGEPAAGDAAGKGASLFGVTAVPPPRRGRPTAWAVGSPLPQFVLPWRPIVQAYGSRPVSCPRVGPR